MVVKFISQNTNIMVVVEMIPEEQIVLRALYDQNPWWLEGNVPKELVKPLKDLKTPFKRRDFFVLRDKLNEKEITAIVGPRQVGKTTTLYQLVDYLIKKKEVDPKRVFYFSFDHPLLPPQLSLNRVLETYATAVLREPLRRLRAPVYVFLDEICRVKDWSRLLKGWYDLKCQIKFVVSHSSSSEILTGASESLVGRISPFLMMPLKFVDVVRFYEPEVGETINRVSLRMRRAVFRAIKVGNAWGLFSDLREMRRQLAPWETTIKALLRDYLLRDGYPGLLGTSSLKACARKLRDYLSLTLYKDVVQIFNIRDPRAIEELMILLADATSQLIEYSQLSETLGVKLDTLKSYLNYLEMVFLISRAEFYSKSRAKRIRKRNKAYVANVGLRNALLGELDESLLRDPAALGRVAETVVHEHCVRLGFNLSGGSAKLFYWRDVQGREVDIIMEVGRRPVPIEVTLADELPTKKFQGLEEFMRIHRCPLGFVVTKEVLELRGAVVYVPLWMFLLVC